MIKSDLCLSCCRREVCLPVIKRKILCNLLSFASSELQLQVCGSLVYIPALDHILAGFIVIHGTCITVIVSCGFPIPHS